MQSQCEDLSMVFRGCVNFTQIDQIVNTVSCATWLFWALEGLNLIARFLSGN